jgi:hypothetical protein
MIIYFIFFVYTYGQETFLSIPSVILFAILIDLNLQEVVSIILFLEMAFFVVDVYLMFGIIYFMLGVALRD